MKILIVGRTKILLITCDLLIQNGFQIIGIITCRASEESIVDEFDYYNYSIINKIPFLKTQKINSDESLKFINNLGEIDISLSMNWIGVIGEKFISKFRLGVLNAHGGDLPRYRGNACQAWAIINGEKEIGLCIHKMVPDELDSGDILLKKKYPINISTRIGDVYKWFDSDIPQMFFQAVILLKDNPDYIFESQSKNPKDTLRCYPRMPEDGKIEWSNTAESIVRLVNASSEPYSGAFCVDRVGNIIKVWRAELDEDIENWIGVPGQIVRFLNNGELVLLTGKGKIKISEIEFNGIRSVPGAFFKSLRIRFY